MYYIRPAIRCSEMTFNSVQGTPKATALVENVQAGAPSYSASAAYEADE